MRSRVSVRFPRALLLVTALLAAAVAPAANVTTHHYDNFRSGWNWQEPGLTTANVSSIGQLATTAVDEQVDAQPLVLNNQSINGTLHASVVYVATENNSVYALDGSSGAILAQTHLETAVTVATVGGISGCTNNSVVVGINSTPVIDPSTGTLYVVTATVVSSSVSYHLHALDVSTLADKVTALAISTPSGLNRQRAALTLFNGGVLIPFTSFCDSPTSTFGALVYATTSPASQTSFGTTTTNLATIWMSGAGPAAYGNTIYVATGNGGGPYPPSGSPSANLPESLVALQGSAGSPLSLTFSSLFTPSNYSSLDGSDLDFGAGGVLLVPSGAPASIVPGTTTANFVTAAGKFGSLYVNGLGLGPTPTQTLTLGGSCHCAESYFTGSSGTGYVVTSAGTTLGLYSVSSSGLTLVNSTSLPSKGLGYPGYFTSISSNGTAAGSAIIWVVVGPTAAGLLTLQAYDPTTLTLLTSLNAGTWSSTGATANTVPVVANSKIYIASYKQVVILGLAPYLDTPVMTIGGIPGGGGFSTASSVLSGLPSAGSMSPSTTANGYTYVNFYTRSPPRSGQINGFFEVSGFTSDPGQGWLISASAPALGVKITGSVAQYSYANGAATWTLDGGASPFPSSGTVTCLIAHK